MAGVEATPAAYVWIRVLAKVCVVVMISGISVAAFFSTLYLSRLNRMVEYLKGSNRREWRRLGSPDTPLSWGMSKKNAGKVFRFIVLGPPSKDSALEKHRSGTRSAFIVFVSAALAAFLSTVAIPLSAIIASSMR